MQNGKIKILNNTQEHSDNYPLHDTKWTVVRGKNVFGGFKYISPKYV